MTSAAAFDTVLIRSSVIAPVVTARLNARTCAPRLHRLVRIGIVRLGVLRYLLTERKKKRMHAHQDRDEN